MKRLLFLVLFLILWLVIPSTVRGGLESPAEKMGVLEGIFRPQSLLISGERVIIAQESKFHVFRLRDLTLLQTFCSEGEGPGELKSVPMIPTTLKRVGRVLVAEGMNKIIIYTPDQLRVVEEQKKGGMLWNFVPFGGGFLATRFQPRGGDRIDVTLFKMSGELGEAHTLHLQQTVDRDKEIIMLRDAIGFAILDDKLYVEKSNLGFVIDVYDAKCQHLFRIKRNDFQPHPLNAAYKRALMENLKNDALIKRIAKARGGWDSFAKETTFTFPDYLPSIRAIKAWNGRLYVLTHNGGYNEAEMLILEAGGKMVARNRVPYTPSPYFSTNALGKSIELWDVGPGGYYFLRPEGDEDEWQLYRCAQVAGMHP